MSTPSRIRLAITDDHAPTRHVLRANLSAFLDVEVIAAAGSGEELLEELDLLPADRLPHVVLMDIEMPGLGGIETTARIKARYPGIDVLMLTVFDVENVIFEAVQVGASGYLLKDEQPAAIREACIELRRGGAPMSAAVARKTLRLLRESQPPLTGQAMDSIDAVLSDREREILEGLVRGTGYSQLAQQLYLSPHTVRTHIKNIYKKLHVHSRSEAIRLALRRSR